MTRLQTSPNIETAPAASQPLLQGLKTKLGSVPNLFRVIASSPAALEGFLALRDALSKGGLAAPTRERIALAIAELNGCAYCLSAHTYIARNVAKLDDNEITANRNGASNDPTADAAVKFAVRIVETRGHVTDADIAAIRQAGYDDAGIVEIILHVALNTLTNYVNEVAGTEIDFPAIARPRKA